MALPGEKVVAQGLNVGTGNVPKWTVVAAVNTVRVIQIELAHAINYIMPLSTVRLLSPIHAHVAIGQHRNKSLMAIMRITPNPLRWNGCARDAITLAPSSYEQRERERPMADIQDIVQMVDELGERIAKKVKTEVEFLAWLTAARDNLNAQIEALGGKGTDGKGDET